VQFLKLAKREEVYKVYFPRFRSLSTEKVSIFNAFRRFLAQDFVAPHNIPYFPRSTVDGFAVRAKDTVGASSSSPVLLKLVGEIGMSERPTLKVGEGEAVRIWTGGWLPEGADAVVMLESAEVNGEWVEVFRSCGSGENVLDVGDDVKEGEVVIQKGTFLRAQELALLASFGVLEVEVYRKPRVLIIPTGNELVEPWQEIGKGKIRETNSFSVAHLIGDYCEKVDRHPIVRDDKESLFYALRQNMPRYDLILLSGGSSKGSGDFSVNAILDFEDSEIIFHGVYISPGKPTIFARIKEKPIIGLPGHPVSSFIATYLFVLPFVKYLQGAYHYLPEPSGYLKLSEDVPSKAGREEWVRVKRDGDCVAPLFSESGVLSSLVKAQGLIRVPENREGIHKGEEVEFYPLW